MRNILTVFLVTSLLMHLPEGDRSRAAKDVFHTFVIGVYFFPLLGGWLADRFFGKYNTIFWLSLVYCAGHACLAIFEDNRNGFYAGLALIALGSGGIKPCVSAFVGDQFDQRNKHRAKVVFDAFTGSLISARSSPRCSCRSSCAAMARASRSAFPARSCSSRR
jgi:POT family proton-dependent oligopeptide transporter